MIGKVAAEAGLGRGEECAAGTGDPLQKGKNGNRKGRSTRSSIIKYYFVNDVQLRRGQIVFKEWR